MKIEEILERISQIGHTDENYLVFQTETDGCFFGKNHDGHVVFMIKSNSPMVPPVNQETKSLRFSFNKKCLFTCNNNSEKNTMHVLTCKEKDDDKIKAFIRLTKSFSINETGQDQYYFAKLFSSLSALFDKQRRVSEIEVQGLFAELYTILYLLCYLFILLFTLYLLFY